MATLSDFDVERIAGEAFMAAEAASKAYLDKYGERDTCGFSWTVLRPGNCKMAKYLVSRGLASSHHTGGVAVWNPGKANTQSITAKEEGAYAFTAVMRKYGIKASTDSRMD
jgi:hypothetical protein